ACGQLGEREAARNAVRELPAPRPDFPREAREELWKWWAPELGEPLIYGLRKAGPELAREGGTDSRLTPGACEITPLGKHQCRRQRALRQWQRRAALRGHESGSVQHSSARHGGKGHEPARRH